MTRRRLIVGAALIAAVLVGVGVYVYKHETDPIEKRGSASDEFVTTEAPKPKPPPKESNPRPWPTYGYDVGRQHISPYDARPPYRRLWKIDAHETLEFPPTIGYGNVYLAQQKGEFFALNAKTGRVVWRKSLGRCAASSPTIGKGVVYQSYMHPVQCLQDQAGANGFVVAWNAKTGRQLWRFNTAPIESSPLLKNGRLYVGSWDHKVHALNAETGKQIWSFQADDQVNTSAAYWHGRIFIATDGGTLYSLSARTGRLLWARPLGTYIYGAAAVYKRRVFVGTYDGKFYALDAATGDTIWQINARGAVHAAPTVIDGLVYYAVCSSCGEAAARAVARGPDATYAVRASNGKTVWHFADGKYANPVVADEDRIYLTGRSHEYGLEPRHARKQQR